VLKGRCWWGWWGRALYRESATASIANAVRHHARTFWKSRNPGGILALGREGHRHPVRDFGIELRDFGRRFALGADALRSPVRDFGIEFATLAEVSHWMPMPFAPQCETSTCVARHPERSLQVPKGIPTHIERSGYLATHVEVSRWRSKGIYSRAVNLLKDQDGRKTQRLVLRLAVR
jgi:hypothetical protein